MRLLLKCDLFRTVQDTEKHLTPATSSGAGTSVAMFTVLAILLIGEFVNYFSGHTQCTVHAGSAVSTALSAAQQIDLYNVHADITFPFIPCSKLEVRIIHGSRRRDADLESRMGLKRTPTVNGRFSEPSHRREYLQGDPQAESMGCNLRVDSVIPTAPFYLAFVIKDDADINLPPSHAIHSFYLGGKSITGCIPQVTRDTVEPLAGFSNGPANHGHPHPFFVEHYVQTLQTSIRVPHGPTIYGFQYTSNYAQVFYSGRGRNPGAYFKINPSEYGVVCSITYDGVSHFMVHLCAVIGGVYTICSIVELALEMITKERRRRERTYQHALNTEIEQKKQLMRTLLPSDLQ